MARLTKPLLDAMATALDAALAGEGFTDGDFEGMDRTHFERALDWVRQEQQRRGAAPLPGQLRKTRRFGLRSFLE